MFCRYLFRGPLVVGVLKFDLGRVPLPGTVGKQFYHYFREMH